MTTTNPKLEQEARKKSFVTIGKKKITPVMIAFAKWHGQNAKNLAMLQNLWMLYKVNPGHSCISTPVLNYELIN